MDKPGFYFCICPDSMLARDHARNMLSACGQGDAPLNVFWADEGLDDTFWETLTLQGLGVTKKNLFIRNAQVLPSETWKKLSTALGTPRTGILPVFFLESAWEKGQPKLPAHMTKLRCFEFAEKKRWIWRAPALDARATRRFIQERATSLGLSIQPDLIEVLGETLPPDAASLLAALEQLSLLAENGVVKPEHTKNIAQYAPDLVLFDLIRHIQEGRADKAWRSVLRESEGGDAVLFPLLGLMAREGRLLWQLHAGENVYVPQHVAGMKRQLAARLGFTGVARLFSALCEAEWSVKSGRLQPGQALERLIAELTLLFAPAQKYSVMG